MRSAASTFVALVVIFFLTAEVPFLVHAQVAPAYWCGIYWSTTPCTFGGYGSQYEDPHDPENSFYTYPDQYYPSNYNFYFPYRSTQYFYDSLDNG